MNHDLRRRVVSRIVIILCALSVAVALLPLALVLIYVVTQGIASLSTAFFTDLPKPVGEPGGGMANAIVGSVIVTLLGAPLRDPNRHHEWHLRGRVLRHSTGDRRAFRCRHAQRRAVDCDRNRRLHHRGMPFPPFIRRWLAVWRWES